MIGKFQRMTIDHIFGFGQPERRGSHRLLGKYREDRRESRWVRRWPKRPYGRELRFYRDGIGHHCALCAAAAHPFHENRKGFSKDSEK